MNKTYKLLKVTNKELLELEQIIEDCQNHLQDYDIDNVDGDYDDEENGECPYKETNDNCTKWSKILEELRNKKYGKQREYEASAYGGGG